MRITHRTRDLCEKLSNLINDAAPDTSMGAWTADSLYNQPEIAQFFVDDLLRPQSFLALHAPCEDADIHMLCVHPDLRRACKAQALLSEAFDWAQQNSICKIILEVSVVNQPAIQLYKKSGFQMINIRKNYYRLPNDCFEDALILEKYLERQPIQSAP